MKADNLVSFKDNELQINSEVEPEEKIVLVLDNQKQKNLDDTISNPNHYLSRYHYETKSVDAYMELCPHCKNPSLESFRRAVIDSAILYLSDKEDERVRKSSRRRTFGIIGGALVVFAGLYYWLFYLVSGLRV